MRPLGKNQLQRLMGLASPGCLLIVAGDQVSKSLAARGFCKPHFPDKPGAWHRITPAGLRALADAYEAGQLNQFMKTFPCEETDAPSPASGLPAHKNKPAQAHP